MMWRSRDIARLLNAAHHGADVAVLSVNTDSRAKQNGSLFIALKGERFDAHDFVVQASANGAVAALVERAVDADICQIVVPDVRAAMAKLARDWRLMQPAFVVGLTGSCGKTTVKEMLASIFRQTGPTLATHGNLNNEIGVPLTLFQLRSEHRYAVIEMGANHLGEIAYCAAMAQPQVALITLVAPAHLEGFGSIDNVAKAKSEIYQSLPDNGIAVVNADDAYADYFYRQIGARRVLRFGMQNVAEVTAKNVRCDAQGVASFDLCIENQATAIVLSLPGQHNVMNALSAAALAYASGISLDHIAKGLQQTPTVAGRLNVLVGHNGERIIDDTYNANLASMSAALEYVQQFEGVRIAVLGHMGELGDSGIELHRQLGRRAREKRVTHLFCLGELTRAAAEAFGQGATSFTDIDELLSALKTTMTSLQGQSVTVLVKGSRSAKMERIVQALTPATSLSSGEAH